MKFRIVEPATIHACSVERKKQFVPRLITGIPLLLVFYIVPTDGKLLFGTNLYLLQSKEILQQCLLIDFLPVVQISKQTGVIFPRTEIFDSYLPAVCPVKQPQISDELPQAKLLVVWIRLSYALDSLPLDLSCRLIHILIMLVRTLGNQRFLAFQWTLIEDKVGQKQVSHILVKQAFAMGLIALIQFFRTLCQHFLASQLLVMLGLLAQDSFQFLFIIFAFNSTDEVSTNLIGRFCQQMVIDKGTDGLARCFQLRLGAFLPKPPIVFTRCTERPLDFTVFIFLQSRSVLLILGGYNELLGLSYPIIQGYLAGTAVYPSVFQLNTIPGIAPFSFFCGFYADYFQLIVFLALRWSFFFLLPAQLTISSFLIEVKQYPRQLLLADSLREGLFPQVIECPVQRDLPSVSHQCGLMTGEIGHHFVEGVHEKETHGAILKTFPGQLGLAMIEEFAISEGFFPIPTYCGIVVRGQKSHHVQHPVQALPPQQRTLPYPPNTSKTSTNSRLRFRHSLVKVA